MPRPTIRTQEPRLDPFRRFSPRPSPAFAAASPPLPIQTSFEDHVGIIALDHYAKRNALSAGMIAAILAAFEIFKARQVRVVILRSAQNGPVWSSGHSVDELPVADRDPLPYDDPLEQILRAVKSFPAPIIAMVHGSVWGGACDLVLACDLVVADETASFAITPAKIGLPYNIVGILNFMSQLPLAVVREMFFTADPIDARRAERIGLVNRLTAPEELEAETFALARKIASRSPAAISAFKEATPGAERRRADQPRHLRISAGLAPQRLFRPGLPRRHRRLPRKRPPKF